MTYPRPDPNKPESVFIQNSYSHESICRKKKKTRKEEENPPIYLRSLCTPTSSKPTKRKGEVSLSSVSEKSTDVQWGVRDYLHFFGQGREEARYCVCILRGNRRRPYRRRPYRRCRYAVYSTGVIPGKYGDVAACYFLVRKTVIRAKKIRFFTIRSATGPRKFSRPEQLLARITRATG